MQFKKSLMTATLVTLGSFAAMSSANASGTKSSEFGITTTITSVCAIDATAAAISFTDIAAGTALADGTISNKKSAGDISVMCSNDAPYVINLTTTGNSASTTGEGLMTGVLGDTITYQLHSTLAGDAPWGNAGTLEVTGNGVSDIGIGVSTPVLHSVYATITGSTDVKQDTYSDTITASVIY